MKLPPGQGRQTRSQQSLASGSLGKPLCVLGFWVWVCALSTPVELCLTLGVLQVDAGFWVWVCALSTPMELCLTLGVLQVDVL